MMTTQLRRRKSERGESTEKLIKVIFLQSFNYNYNCRIVITKFFGHFGWFETNFGLFWTIFWPFLAISTKLGFIITLRQSSVYLYVPKLLARKTIFYPLNPVEPNINSLFYWNYTCMWGEKVVQMRYRRILLFTVFECVHCVLSITK